MQISNLFCAQRVISRSLLYKQKVNNYTLIDEQKTGLLAIQKSLQIREQTEMEVKTNGEIWTINLNVSKVNASVHQSKVVLRNQ